MPRDVTDRPVNPPSTEAGRALVRWQAHPVGGYNPVNERYWAQRVAEIEVEARAEGRQQAVRAISDYLDASERFGPDQHPERCHQGMRDTLDRVAGLNASDSTLPEPHHDYAGRTCTTGLLHAHPASDSTDTPLPNRPYQPESWPPAEWPRGSPTEPVERGEEEL